jgi:uncharacterized protein YjdB
VSPAPVPGPGPGDEPEAAAEPSRRVKTPTIILAAVIALVLGAGAGFGLSAVNAKSVSAEFGGIEAVDGIYSIAPGESVEVSLLSQPKRLFLDKLTLESSRPSVLQVRQDGDKTKIEGVKTGKAQVTVRSSARHATRTYSFNVSVPPESLEGLPDNLVLDLDETLTLEPEVVPAESTYPVGFSSSDDSVASVSQDGEVTGRAAGTATVTAVCGQISHEIAIEVHRKVTSVDVGPSLELVPGQTHQLEPVITPDDAADKTVTYRSDSPESVSVSNTGLISVRWTDRSAGSATITVESADGPSARLDVSVSNPYLGSPEDEPVAITGTSYQVTPLAFGTAIPNCTGLTVDYGVVEASSTAYLGQLRGSTTFDIRVAGTSGGWESVGTFTLDGASSKQAAVTFSARTVARVAVVPTTGAGAGTSWRSTISVSGVLFEGQSAEGDT